MAGLDNLVILTLCFPLLIRLQGSVSLKTLSVISEIKSPKGNLLTRLTKILRDCCFQVWLDLGAQIMSPETSFLPCLHTTCPWIVFLLSHFFIYWWPDGYQ